MSRRVGLDDLPRVAELIDQTVVLLRYGCGSNERELLTGLAQRLRVDYEEITQDRSRAAAGHLLPQTDPRVIAAERAALTLIIGNRETLDWRDVAEVVNVVLEVDDLMAAGSTDPLADMRAAHLRHVEGGLS